MRFAEAMRLGAALRPQAFGELFDSVGSCAMGAVMEAVGAMTPSRLLSMDPFKASMDGHASLQQKYPWIYKTIVKHPITGIDFPLNHTVVDLNNYYRWNREQIADWVDTVDPTMHSESEITLQEEAASQTL